MICDSCGFNNDDFHKSCTGCGKKLPVKPSDEQLNAMLNKVSAKSDALLPSTLDRLMKWVCFVSAIIFFILNIAISGQILFSVFSAITSVLAGIIAGYPKLLWSLDKLNLKAYTYADGMYPNDIWSAGRKISYWILFGVSIAFVIFASLASFE